ncbi:MAG: hypothetical protein JJU10_12075 [Idiomarina sp.]|nr:hypothetical protein [Idiomarina sp.]
MYSDEHLNQHLDQRIVQLTQQLPLQRRRLMSQASTVTSAVRTRMSSPAALATAAIVGGFIGVWLQKPVCDKGCEPAEGNGHSLSGWNFIYQSMWFGLLRAIL